MSSTKGLREWIAQRLTAVYMALYIVLMFAYLASHPHLSYAVWRHLFHVFWVQSATIIFLVCLMWHAWIGLWTIFTDYVKVLWLRKVLEVIVLLALVFYLIWGIQVVWHIPMVWSF